MICIPGTYDYLEDAATGINAWLDAKIASGHEVLSFTAKGAGVWAVDVAKRSPLDPAFKQRTYAGAALVVSFPGDRMNAIAAEVAGRRWQTGPAAHCLEDDVQGMIVYYY